MPTLLLFSIITMTTSCIQSNTHITLLFHLSCTHSEHFEKALHKWWWNLLCSDHGFTMVPYGDYKYYGPTHSITTVYPYHI